MLGIVAKLNYFSHQFLFIPNWQISLLNFSQIFRSHYVDFSLTISQVTSHSNFGQFYSTLLYSPSIQIGHKVVKSKQECEMGIWAILFGWSQQYLMKEARIVQWCFLWWWQSQIQWKWERWRCEGQQQWDLMTSTNDFEGLSCGSGCGGVSHGGGR